MAIWLSCEQAGLLTSDALDRPLTRRERLGLTLHRAMCDRCAALARDFAAMRAKLQRLAAGLNAEHLPVPPLDETRLAEMRAAVAAAASRADPR